ncbi:hypothetical protein V6N12_014742 [Hibiscus sabdariffa]|uniref:Uncharacterized protein n=1 Tax=Hibiscus sabdariffa TaxID=183260 RepID=A0ABR2DLH9_9ROSI
MRKVAEQSEVVKDGDEAVGVLLASRIRHVRLSEGGLDLRRHNQDRKMPPGLVSVPSPGQGQPSAGGYCRRKGCGMRGSTMDVSVGMVSLYRGVGVNG